MLCTVLWTRLGTPRLRHIVHDVRQLHYEEEAIEIRGTSTTVLSKDKKNRLGKKNTNMIGKGGQRVLCCTVPSLMSAVWSRPISQRCNCKMLRWRLSVLCPCLMICSRISFHSGLSTYHVEIQLQHPYELLIQHQSESICSGSRLIG